MCEEILKHKELAEKKTILFHLFFQCSRKVFSVGGDLVEMKRAVGKDDIASLHRIAGIG